MNSRISEATGRPGMGGSGGGGGGRSLAQGIRVYVLVLTPLLYPFWLGGRSLPNREAAGRPGMVSFRGAKPSQRGGKHT